MSNSEVLTDLVDGFVARAHKGDVPPPPKMPGSGSAAERIGLKPKKEVFRPRPPKKTKFDDPRYLGAIKANQIIKDLGIPLDDNQRWEGMIILHVSDEGIHKGVWALTKIGQAGRPTLTSINLDDMTFGKPQSYSTHFWIGNEGEIQVLDTSKLGEQQKEWHEALKTEHKPEPDEDDSDYVKMAFPQYALQSNLNEFRTYVMREIKQIKDTILELA